MTEKHISESIIRAAGIESLNEMQRTMLQSEASSIILISPTGSGKTIAFATRLLKNLVDPADSVQAIVIAPSRELVMQIAEVLRPISKGYKTVAMYGGHSMIDEKNSLMPIPDIIIATPGRLLDHLQRGNISVNGLKTLVLDEYDKSLELGFEGEMRRIISRIGKTQCLILTSATPLSVIPEYIKAHSPLTFDFRSENKDPRQRTETIEVVSYTRDKLDTALNLLRTFKQGERSIVFVNHRESAERVYQRFKHEGIPATLYHGALDQHQRAMAIDLFTNGTAPVLVATDLAARGLDINGVTNIIHYHMPVNEQAWTHRNGRTARVNQNGLVWLITSETDNQPEYIKIDRSFNPPQLTDEPKDNACAPIASLYISAGKKEKISRGDIAGFVSASEVTRPDEIGKIAVHDHHSLVAIPRCKARETAKELNQLKLKGKKVRVSIV